MMTCMTFYIQFALLNSCKKHALLSLASIISIHLTFMVGYNPLTEVLLISSTDVSS